MSEINLIGGFYQAKSLPFSAQDTVNWLPVPAKVEGARSPIKLRGLPGLKSFLSQPGPPQSFRLSSTPYPIEAIDAMDSTATAASGELSLADSYAYVEAMDSGATLSGGELRTTLKSYTFTEAVDSTVALNSGELRTILKSYNFTEAVDSTATLAGGTLATILIQYQNYPAEALDSTATITGGALA